MFSIYSKICRAENIAKCLYNDVASTLMRRHINVMYPPVLL